MKTKGLLLVNIILLYAVILMGVYICNEKNEMENEMHDDCVENFINLLLADISIDINAQESTIYHMHRNLYYDSALMCLRMYDREKGEESETHVFYGCVENPIDPLFSDALIKARGQSEITYRMCQELYYNTWKSQYETIMQIIREKCKYEEDIENYELFVREMEEGFDRLKPLILNEMLDNYDMPKSPEKHGYGNGTNGALLMYQGTVYRTACMFFVPMLDKEEYCFPQEEIQEAIAEILDDSK